MVRSARRSGIPPHPPGWVRARRRRRAPRRGRAAAAILGGALALSAALPTPRAAAEPGRPLPLVLQDDATLLNRTREQVRDAVETAAGLGVGVVRLTASWSRIAPDPQATRRPAFDPRDPDAYGTRAWEHLDLAVREARRAGLRVLIDVAFWAPRWALRDPATADRARPRNAPDPDAFAAFAEAVARRYRGDHVPPGQADPLPRVDLLATWNEPNHPSFLSPQWRRDPAAPGGWRAASPAVYRAMHLAADAAIRRAAPGTTVLLGNLAAIGGPPGEHGVPPLRFLRDLACVDERLRPRSDGDCGDFRPVRADGLAYHPYTRYVTPGTRAAARDQAALADLPRLHELLERLRAAGRLRLPEDAPLWLTEYGYETREDDPYQPFTRADQARFAGWSAYLAWRAPGVVSDAQFLLRDIDPAESGIPADDRRHYRDWQSGVLDHRGRPKPGAAATMLPLWPRIVGDGAHRRLWVFARVRPGAGPRAFRLERWTGADWTPVLLDACGPPRPGCGPPGAGSAGGGSGWGGETWTDPQGAALRTGPALGPGPYRLLWRNGGRWVAGPPVTAHAE